MFFGIFPQAWPKQLPQKKRRKKRSFKHPCGANESGQCVKSKRPLGNRARYCETCKHIRKDGPRDKFDPSHVLRKLREDKAEFPRLPASAHVFTFGARKRLWRGSKITTQLLSMAHQRKNSTTGQISRKLCERLSCSLLHCWKNKTTK